MTRINVIPAEQLSNKHLVAEYNEITRVFHLVKVAVSKGRIPDHYPIPEDYVMGKGHVIFFYNKLKFIERRYSVLFNEMRRRGMEPNGLLHNVKRIAAHNEIPRIWWGDYSPTPEALKLNRERIEEKNNVKST